MTLRYRHDIKWDFVSERYRHVKKKINFLRFLQFENYIQFNRRKRQNQYEKISV